jgi:hypothetical protein
LADRLDTPAIITVNAGEFFIGHVYLFSVVSMDVEGPVSLLEGWFGMSQAHRGGEYGQ